jgi:hypothetical protein
MKRLTFAMYLALACAFALGQTRSTPKPNPCKTPEIAPTCFTTYGELASGYKDPSYVLWEPGKNRPFRIYRFPRNVEHALWDSASGSWSNVVIGWFEVCPLDTEKMKSKQLTAACIESATDLGVKAYK